MVETIDACFKARGNEVHVLQLPNIFFIEPEVYTTVAVATQTW
jgi:hypothetical protein